MAENKIEIKSIQDLLGMNFVIPAYQRGYRWTAQQVKDLLDDIQEFIDKRRELRGFYCIQPLVVKDLEKDLNEVKNLLKGRWEVVDGQQRLTAIYILLSYFNSTENYSIEYVTREGSKYFLANMDESKEGDNIDYHHMIAAKRTITDWFKINNKSNDSKMNFENNLLKNVKFIWYESIDEDAVKVFTRLNIGKISLTNAELIKALFLNKSNFQDSIDYRKIRLQQQKIAGEWDMIEYILQNDEFWLFLNEVKYDKPTRIDFIFDMMCEKNILKLECDYQEKTGKDEYRTFRYFYLWFNKDENKNKITNCWKEVKKLFQTFQEWFNDLELYHYIGFLVENETKISTLMEKWSELSSKQEFVKELISEIREILSSCKDLEKQYEIDGPAKTKCRPLLLLHNIKTIIDQNKTLVNDEKYKMPVFYKFPFHLFKKETWDVEHIDSQTENQLDKPNDQKEWLRQSYDFVSSDLQNAIKEFVEKHKTDDTNDEGKQKFEELHKKIIRADDKGKLSDDEKNKLWNFCLLDSSTNRSYGNAIFPAKRRVIIGKSQGKEIKVKDDFSVTEESGAIAFIPPCTEKVFQKFFNPVSANLREWDKTDAEAYLGNIKDTLEIFL